MNTMKNILLALLALLIIIFIPWICIMLASEFVWAGDFSWNPYDWTPQGRANYLLVQIVSSLLLLVVIYTQEG